MKQSIETVWNIQARLIAPTCSFTNRGPDSKFAHSEVFKVLSEEGATEARRICLELKKYAVQDQRSCKLRTDFLYNLSIESLRILMHLHVLLNQESWFVWLGCMKIVIKEVFGIFLRFWKILCHAQNILITWRKYLVSQFYHHFM